MNNYNKQKQARMPNPKKTGSSHPTPTRYTQPVYLFIYFILTYLNNLKLKDKDKNKNTVELPEDAHNLEKRGSYKSESYKQKCAKWKVAHLNVKCPLFSFYNSCYSRAVLWAHDEYFYRFVKKFIYIKKFCCNIFKEKTIKLNCKPV